MKREFCGVSLSLTTEAWPEEVGGGEGVNEVEGVGLRGICGINETMGLAAVADD